MTNRLFSISKVLFVSFMILFLNSIVSAEDAKVPDEIILDKQSKSRGLAKISSPTFTHKKHSEIIKCNTCHGGAHPLFIKKIGANVITMRDQMAGEYCGRCHDGIVSFGMSDCYACHRKEEKKSK